MTQRANEERPARETPAAGAMDSAMLQELLRAKERDDELRDRTLAVQARSVEANQAVALASIQAQREYAQNRTKSEERRETRRLVCAAFVACLVAAFCAYALFLGKEHIVLKLGEIIAVFLAGYFTGSGRKNSGPRPPDSRD